MRIVRLLHPLRCHFCNTPSLACPRSIVDLYTVNGASNGNGQLVKPVSLLTVDETNFAGSGGRRPNSYLRSGSDILLLSPYYRPSYGYVNGVIMEIDGTLRHSEKWREDARFALVIGRTLRVLKITGASRK